MHFSPSFEANSPQQTLRNKFDSNIWNEFTIIKFQFLRNKGLLLRVAKFFLLFSLINEQDAWYKDLLV